MILCSAIVSTATGCLAEQAASRPGPPTTHGVSLAFPTSRTIHFSRNLTNGLPYAIKIPLVLRVDEKGTVQSVRGEYAADSVWVRGLDSTLKALAFVPGSMNSTAQSQEVPVEVLLYPQVTTATLSAPVDDSGKVTDQDFYDHALLANDVTNARFEQLPSYFCPFKSNDSLSVLPFVIFRIALDESGLPSAIEPIRSTLPALTQQMFSLFNWATYSPARQGNRVIRSDNFAVVVFHPGARYPTRPFGVPTRDSAGLVERRLARLVSDTTGLVVPPLPHSLSFDSLAMIEAAGKNFGRVSLWCAIDTVGRVTVTRIDPSGGTIMRLCQGIVDRIRFYPAFDFSGRPQSFYGLIHIDFDGSAIVRIHLNWLPDPKSPPLR